MKRLALLAVFACLPAWGDGASVTLPHGVLELSGRLYAPDGTGPYPAIVLLHGCNGMWGRNGEPNTNYEPVEIDVYEGAHHAFDGREGRVRFRPEVRNAASPSGRGADVGPDPVARERGWIRVTEFIESRR